MSGVKAWRCPSCGFEHRSYDPRPHVPHHRCPALAGLSVPLAAVGQQARHVLVERGDYAGGEAGLVDVNGRIISSVMLERADGSNDCTVLAPVSTAFAQLNP